MKMAYYLMLAFGFLSINSSCKIGVQEDSFFYPFNFYFTDKATGENLTGDDQAKPFSPYDVSVFLIYDGDLDTKQNDSENFGPHLDKEVGYIFKTTYFFSNRRDYIIQLKDLEPDTLTFILENGEGVKVYLNREFIDDITDGKKSGTPLYKIEKEL